MKLYNLFPRLLLLTALLLPLFALAADNDDLQRGTYEKKLSKTYPVNRTGTVDINTRYGAITYHHWERGEVKMDVRIVVEARSKERAEEAFERVGVRFASSSPNRVTGEVDFDNRNNSWTTIFNWGGSGGNDTKVYWDVYLPASVNLETEARYADVNMEDHDGNTITDVRYGDLATGKLSKQNTIYVGYGSARVESLGSDSEVTMRYSKFSAERVGDLRYDGRYSKCRIDNGGTLEIDAGYETVVIGTATSVEIDGSYNDISVEEVDDIELDGNYGSIEIGTVRNRVEIDARYGDIEIERVVAGFTEIEIEAGYIDIEIDIDEDAGYSFDLSTRYADIDFGRSDINGRQSVKEGNHESLKGSVPGKGSGRVKIETSYGDIEIE